MHLNLNISSEFKRYLITEFERLKQNEGYQNKIEWSVRRELAKKQFDILQETAGIKKIENLDTKKLLDK